MRAVVSPALAVVARMREHRVEEALVAIDPAGRVRFRPGLLPEADAQAIVSNATALLISHADEDVIVSSSFFYAMTLQVPVVAVETPFLRWISTRVGPDLLRLHANVGALCASIGSEPVRPDPTDPLSVTTVEREFGDATVREALRRALDFPPA